MRSVTVLLTAALAALSSAVARSSTGDRVLVVLESQVKQNDYSKLWASLRDHGFQLTFKDPKDASAELIRHGEIQYDHLIMLLQGSRTGYTGKDGALDADEADIEAAVGKTSKQAVLAGRDAKLVSAMQTRDNVRIGFVGSGEMFSDKWWDGEVMLNKNSGAVAYNALLAEDLTKWIFQETGVVKVVATHHHRAGETEPREMYTKKDDLTFTLTLSQHTTTANGSSSWTAFDASDLQLDFTMLDPHVRTALVKDSAASTEHVTTYKAQFRAPDRHGVFKFVVEYWRPGWSYIRSSSTASVVPLRHDDYAKFTTGAWPYYASTLSVSGAFLLFCTLWLAIGEEDRKGKKKAE